MTKQEEMVAWLCWLYGKTYKHIILPPLMNTINELIDLEQLLFRHAKRVRSHWDSYMFKKERGSL